MNKMSRANANNGELGCPYLLEAVSGSCVWMAPSGVACNTYTTCNDATAELKDDDGATGLCPETVSEVLIQFWPSA